MVKGNSALLVRRASARARTCAPGGTRRDGGKARARFGSLHSLCRRRAAAEQRLKESGLGYCMRGSRFKPREEDAARIEPRCRHGKERSSQRDCFLEK